MTSVFNHDSNACWGINQMCSVINDPNNFVNTNKPVSMEWREEIKVENIHGSSKGYYGYIPTHVNTSGNYAMDMHDDKSQGTNVCENYSSMYDFNSHNIWRRKRSHSKDRQDSCKRSKRTDAEGPLNNHQPDKSVDALPTYEMSEDESSTKDSEICNEDVRLVHKKKEFREEDSLEFFERYLKETHGCDFYNFIKSDGDYDF